MEKSNKNRQSFKVPQDYWTGLEQKLLAIPTETSRKRTLITIQWAYVAIAAAMIAAVVLIWPIWNSSNSNCVELGCVDKSTLIEAAQEFNSTTLLEAGAESEVGGLGNSAISDSSLEEYYNDLKVYEL